MTSQSVKTIGIFIYDGAEELDFVGPYEVFTMINEVCAFLGQPEAVKVVLISADGKDIMGRKGMRVGAHAAMSDIDQLDVICIPGGDGSRVQIDNPRVVEWIVSIAQHCEWVTSVCTGSFILAKAGLTQGRKITTHWNTFEEFEALGLPGDLQRDVRYICDGNLVTSAGISAGIDMALWLTGQLFSPDMARGVQKAMEYDPKPPYAETV